LNMISKFRIHSTALITTDFNLKFLLKLKIILEKSTAARACRALDPSPSILLIARRARARARARTETLRSAPNQGKLQICLA
jgi:hypothetical protein